jgi:low temperature requirement protein LtrA
MRRRINQSQCDDDRKRDYVVVDKDERDDRKSKTTQTFGDVPWRNVVPGALMFVGGIVLIAFGVSLLFDIESSDETVSRAQASMVLGTLLFLPGFYVVFLIAAISLGVPGYSWTSVIDLTR